MVLLLLMLTRRVPEVQREGKEGITACRILHKAATRSVAEATLFLQFPLWDSDWDKKSQMQFV